MSGEIQKIAIRKALALLGASGATYKVIEADGTEHGTLEVKRARSRRKDGSPVRPHRNPRGLLRNYVLPYLRDVPVGSGAVVPYGDFDSSQGKKDLQSAVCNYCTSHWGSARAGVYMTLRGEKGIEVLRLTEDTALSVTDKTL